MIPKRGTDSAVFAVRSEPAIATRRPEGSLTHGSNEDFWLRHDRASLSPNGDCPGAGRRRAVPVSPARRVTWRYGTEVNLIARVRRPFGPLPSRLGLATRGRRRDEVNAIRPTRQSRYGGTDCAFLAPGARRLLLRRHLAARQLSERPGHFRFGHADHRSPRIETVGARLRRDLSSRRLRCGRGRLPQGGLRSARFAKVIPRPPPRWPLSPRGPGSAPRSARGRGRPTRPPPRARRTRNSCATAADRTAR